MTIEAKDALLNWAHVISSEVQNLCRAAENALAEQQVGNAVRKLNDAMKMASESEIIAAQASRIRDLISANVSLMRACADVIRSADKTGCTEDLNVINASAFTKLHKAFADAGGSL